MNTAVKSILKQMIYVITVSGLSVGINFAYSAPEKTTKDLDMATSKQHLHYLPNKYHYDRDVELPDSAVLEAQQKLAQKEMSAGKTPTVLPGDSSQSSYQKLPVPPKEASGGPTFSFEVDCSNDMITGMPSLDKRCYDDDRNPLPSDMSDAARVAAESQRREERRRQHYLDKHNKH